MNRPSVFAPFAVLLVSCSFAPPGTPADGCAYRCAYALESLGMTLNALRERSQPGKPFDDDTWMLLEGERGLIGTALPGPDAATVPVRGDFVTFSRELLLSRPDLFGVRDPSELVLDGIPDIAADGTTDVAFNQVVAGGRVQDARATVRIFRNRTLRAVFSSLRVVPRIPPARVTPDQALRAARAVKTPDGAPFLPKGAPDLVVEEGRPRGAFQLRYWVYGGTPRLCPPGRCIWPKDGLERPGGPTEPHGAKVSVDARTGVAAFGEYGRIYLDGPP